MNTNAAETKLILAVIEDSPLGIVLMRLREMAKAQNNDKGHYSMESFTEDLLATAAKNFKRYLEADDKRRRYARFNDIVAKLKVPAPGNVAAMQAYGVSIAKLQAQFGVGGQEQEV